MVICNRERVKNLTSDIVITSEMDNNNCEQDLSDADFLDFRTRMDNRSFYEKMDWNKCEDLIFTKNEESLWQAIVGEIKTPLGALNNSIGQATYGCSIWDYRGATLDSLTIKEIEYEIIQTCLKYPEVNNVINIESFVDTNDGALFITLTLDSIYGTFDPHIRIPKALRTDRDWVKSDAKFNKR